MDAPNLHPFTDDATRRSKAEQSFWSLAGLLWARRFFIVGFTGFVAIAAVVISLLLPNWYAATARLLPPEGGSSLSGAILSNLSSAASALLGPTSGDYTRYLALLTSRTLLEDTVNEFDLIEVYELEDSKAPMDYAVGTLLENAVFEVDPEYDYLGVTVFDQDPERSAAITNFMVARLNAMNMRLSALNASSFRESVESRYFESLADLDSLKNRVAAFQRKYGVYDLEAQASAFMEQMARLRAEITSLEIQRSAMEAQYGPENPQVQMFDSMIAEARQTYRSSLAGGEAVLPVSQAEVPELNREFMDLEQERLMQEEILKVLAPLYEQARFEEEREVQAVQVVDPAAVPTLKAKPRRSIIVIAATLSAGMVAVLFVLAQAWWTANAAYVTERLSAATQQPRHTPPPSA